MKPAVAVVLILCGAILIALPALADFMWGMNVARLSEATHAPIIGLAGRMDDGYRVACYAIGVAMIGIAARSSTANRST